MNDGRTIEYRGIRFLTVGKGTLQCQTCLQITHDHIGHAADHAAPTPVPLTATQLDDLPPGSAVRCTTERGRRTSLALKLGGYGLGANSWVTTDGTTFPSSFAIAQADAVLLVPEAVATAPAPVSDTRREDEYTPTIDEVRTAHRVALRGVVEPDAADAAFARFLAALPAPPVADEAEIQKQVIDEARARYPLSTGGRRAGKSFAFVQQTAFIGGGLFTERLRGGTRG